MLRFLRIRRLAVIDAVEVDFDAGLNVLTGETGAGKSILVEAVGLLLGGRASGDLVRTGEETAIVEAIFETGNEELLVRREITAQGRSRAFVNGELTTAGALKDLSSSLIELHGQHEHQTLLDPATHLGTLDLFSGVVDRLPTLADHHAAFVAASSRLSSAQQAHRDRGAREELLRFQVSELERAAIRPGEDEQLAAARLVLSNAERLVRLCEDSYEALYDRDDSALTQLATVWKRVGELSTIDPVFQPFVDARDGIRSQLDDLAIFLRRYADTVEASPARLQETEDRLALLERLKKKFGPTLAEVTTKRDRLRQELNDIEEGDSRIPGLEHEVAVSRTAFLSLAEEVGRDRRRAATAFARALERELAELAMANTRFDVRFGPTLPEAQWSASGVDQAEFFVSPNPGEELRPLARIVSGGELSRVMLALKTLLATSRHGFTDEALRLPSTAAPGLIFDEVDAGIGGRVADVVGRKLRALGSAFQVLCITHQPQIAAYADTHFQIAKSVTDGRTATSVVRLSDAARVDELSRMLAGDSVSDGMRRSAEEMLAARQAKAKGEHKPNGESESRPAKPSSTRRTTKGTR
ncbi:MAG: DNA repair protein RecN [Vicinamibacterales bacterium]